MKTRATTLMTLVGTCAVVLTVHARPLPVLGEGAEPLPERSYSNAAALLEQAIKIAEKADSSRAAYGPLCDAVGILNGLADEPVTDPTNRARCAALMAHILINYYIEGVPARFLFEYHPDFLDQHHAELRAALEKASFDKDAYLENVLCVYAMLPSCDVTFATNKAQEVKHWWLIRDAILARHGDQAALKRLQEAASTYGANNEPYSRDYLSRILSLVRTKAMVEFLALGLREEDIFEVGGGMRLPRWAIYQDALRRMFQYEKGFPSEGDYLEYEAWIEAHCGISLPKNRPLRKDMRRVFEAIPAPMPEPADSSGPAGEEGGETK